MLNTVVRRAIGPLLLILALLLCLGCSTDDDDQDDDDATEDDDDSEPGDEVEVLVVGDDLIIRNRLVSVFYHLNTGHYDVRDAAGYPVVLNAQAVAWSHVLIPAEIWRSGDGYVSSWESADATNALGQGMSISVTRGLLWGHPSFVQSFTLLDGLSCVLADLELRNDSGARIKLGALYPLYTDPAEAALNLGAQRDLRVLTNGFVNYIDFAEPLLPGTEGSVSSWSALLYNQRTGRSLSAGFLRFDHGQPLIYNAPLHGGGDGVQLRAVSEFDPAELLPPEISIAAEPLLLDFGQATPQQALELYAERLKAWLGIETWPERHPEIGVPVGWNSWSGSSSSGGYGTNINEQIILDNMDFADRELRRWGMNFFQIDDGWQDHKGDWQVDEARFPDHGELNGIAWLMQRAKNLGFHAGLWVQAFQADPESAILAEHPEWFAESLLGDSEPSLDLSNPEVQQHLTELAQRLRDWGIEWFKLDFAYRAMFTQGWCDPTLTRMEFYRQGVQTLREALGEDVFLLNVAIVGPNIGLIDSMRLTLDTMPVWEGESDDPYAPLAMIDNQGLKPQYREVARRYYLNNRVWVNHPDLIFFRAHAEEQFPPLTLDESRTFVTAVAMQGGLVKIGDRLVDLSPEAVDSLRRIMPALGLAGRPLDLFSREFPEVWALQVAEFDEPYHVVGLLNWGINRDLTVLPYKMMPDTDRILGAEFLTAGLDPAQTYLAFEFWTQKFLGEHSGALYLEVPAHSPYVVALRPKLGRPQLLGTNRHVLGGAGVIESLTWDGQDKTLTGVQQGAIGTSHAPFTNRVSVYVPAGYSLTDADVDAPAGYAVQELNWDQDDDVAVLSFTLGQTSAKAAAEEFPQVTWELSFE